MKTMKITRFTILLTILSSVSNIYGQASCSELGFEGMASGADQVLVTGWELMIGRNNVAGPYTIENPLTHSTYNCSANFTSHAPSTHCGTGGTGIKVYHNDYQHHDMKANTTASINDLIAVPNLPNLSGSNTRCIRLGGQQQAGMEASGMRTTFTVTDPYLAYHYILRFENTGHTVNNRGFCTFEIRDAGGTVLPCGSFQVYENGPGETWSYDNGWDTWYMDDWKTTVVDLSAYMGQDLTIEVWVADCQEGAHGGWGYFDFECLSSATPDCSVSPSPCANPTILNLASTNGSTCVTDPITINGNTFGGSATNVTITEDGAGSVSPTSSNSSPFGFTYTPAAGDIGNTVTVTVTTNNPLGSPCTATTETYSLTVTQTDPTFTQVSPICSGDPLSALPTTSNNGVTGTWSPALDNTTTTTYTFTPTPGLCANPTDLQIIVNPNPVINNHPQDAAICANGSASLTVDASTGPYQWQYYDTGLSSWINVVNGTPSGFTYLNENSASLDINTANADCNAPLEYRVIVGGAPCEVISNSAFVTVVRASRIAPTGPQCSGTLLNFEACPSAATFNWEVFPPVGTSATPLTGSNELFSFTPTNNTGIDQQFPVSVSMTYLGVTCPQNFNPTIVSLANAGADNSGSLCNSSGSTLDLNTLLEVGVSGGTWSETTGTPSGQFTPVTGILDGSGLPAGAYTFLYDLPATASCPGDQAIFTITVSNQETAGLDDLTLSLCNSAGSTLDLNSVLNGNSVSGTWAETSASGQFTSGTGVFDGNGLPAGQYDFTYTVSGTAPCVADVADFTVTISDQETAGSDDLTLTLCNSAGSTIDLNTALSGNSIAGTWAETTSSGQFTPGTGIFDANGLAAGQYDFTYTVNSAAPCLTDVADFTVTISNQETAGSDDLTLTLCNSAGSTIDLNTALSGNSAAGTWAETTSSGQFTVGTGVLDGSSLAAGQYNFTYTVNSTAPCVADVSDFTVTISNQETAGSDDLTLTLCNSVGSTIDLNTALSGNSMAGAWAETTASGQFTAATGVFDASGLAIGTYTFEYTVNGIAPCVSDVALFGVSVTGVPNAGANNSDVLCNSAGSTIDLNTLLELGVTGGTWSETTGTPSGQFTPATGVLDGSGLTAGAYTFLYDIPATATCLGDQAIFTITVSNQETAGLDDLTLTLCNSTGSTLDLNTALSGNSVVGTWAETSASGQFTSGTGVFDGSGLAAGQYDFTYTVNSAVPCISDLADFTVTIYNQETAGLDDLTLILCNSTGSTLDLNAALNGNSVAGTWAETTASGQFTSGTGVFDGSGLAAGQYDFTYTVNNTAPCVADVADFTVTISNQETAGLDDLILTLCNSAGSTLDLNTALNGNSIAGTWAETTASGQFTSGSGVFDGSGLVAGQYDFTYTVNSTAPCVADVADFTVTISNQETAGLDDLTLTLCNSAGSTLDLNTSLSGNSVAGTWAETTASGQFTSGTGVFDGSGLVAGQYDFTYTVNSTAPCVADVADFTVTISNQETAGLDDLTFTLCNSAGSTLDLNTALNGNSVAGTWAEISASGQFTSGTGVFDGSGLAAGQYDFTYTVNSTAPCVADVADFTVTVNTTPTLTLQDTTDCSPFTVDLSDVNFWSADIGTLTWYSDAALTTILPSTTVGAGTYYVEADNAGCPASGSVVVTEVTTPDVDPLGPIAECDTYTLPVITGTALSGTQAYYTGMGGTGTSYNAGDAITTAGLTTLYIYDGASGCSDEEQLDITITVTPTITAADPAAVCEPNTVDITGSASADVGTLTWYSDAGLTTPIADPTQVLTGTYYVEADNNGCTSNDMVNVTVNPLPLAPTAGTDSTYCSSWTLENMTASGGAGTLTWYDASNNVLGTGSSLTPDMTVGVTEYYVTETLNTCEGPASLVTITINECEITIPTAITPDQDNINDNWEIVDLDAVFPDNVVQVYNRWGNLIFEHVSSPSAPYDQNRWDGTYDGSALPVGSYYYVIKANDADNTVFTGAVSIVIQ